MLYVSFFTRYSILFFSKRHKLTTCGARSWFSSERSVFCFCASYFFINQILFAFVFQGQTYSERDSSGTTESAERAEGDAADSPTPDAFGGGRLAQTTH
jgi:hypothetical protein